MELEATALPTEPYPLPTKYKLLDQDQCCMLLQLFQSVPFQVVEEDWKGRRRRGR